MQFIMARTQDYLGEMEENRDKTEEESCRQNMEEGLVCYIEELGYY